MRYDVRATVVVMVEGELFDRTHAGTAGQRPISLYSLSDIILNDMDDGALATSTDLVSCNRRLR